MTTLDTRPEDVRDPEASATARMRFAMKLLGNLTETRGGDAADRIINALSKITPAG